jgi:hypothetical protein
MNIEEGGPATSHPFAGRRGGNIQPDDKACDDDQAVARGDGNGRSQALVVQALKPRRRRADVT